MIDWKSAIGGALVGAFLWDQKLKRDIAAKKAALVAGVQAASTPSLASTLQSDLQAAVSGVRSAISTGASAPTATNPGGQAHYLMARR